MTTLNWTIEYMSASTQPIAGETEVVLTAGWRCTGTQTNTATPPQTFTASNYGSCSFPEPTTGGQFTPYAQLTQAQVLGWCYANGVNQTEVEASVTQAVATLANPPVVNPPLPWATEGAK
jgi:hypothetical protein